MHSYRQTAALTTSSDTIIIANRLELALKSSLCGGGEVAIYADLTKIEFMKNSSRQLLLTAVSAAAVIAVISAINAGLPAAEPTTQPSDSPTTAPAPRRTDNISVAAVELNDRQLAALSAVRDGQDWNEPAFHIMIAKVDEFTDPKAAAKEYATLESPAVGNLTDFPTRYRAQKIRLAMWVHRSKLLESGSSDWDARPDWPKGRKLWRMDGYHFSPGGKKIEDLVVYSLIDPTELLGKPSRIDKRTGDLLYVERRAVEMAAVYYKTFKRMAKGDKKIPPHIRDYPLVMAYFLKPAKDPGAGSSNLMRNVIVLVVAVMMGLLFMIRRQVKGVRSTPIGQGGAGGVKYTPLRNVEEDDLADEERENEPVDQALVDAVKAFESRKDSYGTDDKS